MATKLNFIMVNIKSQDKLKLDSKFAKLQMAFFNKLAIRCIETNSKGAFMKQLINDKLETFKLFIIFILNKNLIITVMNKSH